MDQKNLFKAAQNAILNIAAYRVTANPAGRTRVHAHPDLWHITYTVQGKGVCIVNGQTYQLRPGFIHSVYPNDVHQYRANTNTPYITYFLNIHCGAPIPAIFPRELSSRQLSRDTLRIFGQLTRLCQALPPPRPLRICALLGLLLADLIERTDAPEPQELLIGHAGRSHSKFTTLLETLRAKPFTYPGIDSLASQLGMSRRYFTQYFKKLTGMTVRAYYLKYRLSYARLLMESGELRIKEIACQCGYTHPQNFARAYKAYRRRQRQASPLRNRKSAPAQRSLP